MAGGHTRTRGYLWSGPRTTLTRDNVSYELTVTVSCVSRTSSRMFTLTRHMRSPPKPVSAGPVSPSHASLERAFPSETPESCAIAQQPGVSAHVQSCCVRSRDCYSNSRRRGGDIPVTTSLTHTYAILRSTTYIRRRKGMAGGHARTRGYLWSGPRTTLTRDMARGKERARACGPVRGQR